MLTVPIPSPVVVVNALTGTLCSEVIVAAGSRRESSINGELEFWPNGISCVVVSIGHNLAMDRLAFCAVCVMIPNSVSGIGDPASVLEISECPERCDTFEGDRVTLLPIYVFS